MTDPTGAMFAWAAMIRCTAFATAVAIFTLRKRR